MKKEDNSILYDVFVSYSRSDYKNEDGEIIPGNIISQIKKVLEENNISYWIDENGISNGDEFAKLIPSNIRSSEIFLFVCTLNSVKSRWVTRELGVADLWGKRIIPFICDNSYMDDSVSMYTTSLDRIEYYSSPQNSLIRLASSIKKYTLDVHKKAVYDEISAIEEQIYLLHLQQKDLLNRIIEKKQDLGEDTKQCPVCECQCGISDYYCHKCGWLFLPYSNRLTGPEKAEENSRLLSAMSIWKGDEIKVQKDAEIGRLAQIISDLGAQIQKMKEGGDSIKQKEQLSPILLKLINNMVRVEGGDFIMGATDEQVDPESDEKPISKVTISSFAINRYEVTQAEWEYVMGGNPSMFKGDNNPVDSVTWEECQTFISRLNSLTGMKFRFPSEAEWEFAARGGIKSSGCQFAGTNDAEEVAWCTVNSSNSSHPVGQRKPNELDLYDMSGNVWEWCQDWFAEYSEATKTNPIGPSTGLLRILRGGSWLSSVRSCRISNRHYSAPTDKDNNIGLRLAL